MKKMLSVIMVGILIFSLTGCGGNNADSGKDSAAANENTVSQETAGAKENASLPAPENEADESGQSELESSMAEQDTAKPESSATTGSETEPDAADGSNALVVYFSWSGNSQMPLRSRRGRMYLKLFQRKPIPPTIMRFWILHQRKRKAVPVRRLREA